MSISGIVILTTITIFTLFILKKKQKRPSDFLLVLINIFLTISVCFDFAGIKEGVNGVTLFMHFNCIFWSGSAFLFYTYSLLLGNGRLVIKWWFFVFSIPFFLYSGYDLLLDPTRSLEVFQKILTEPNMVYHLFFKFHKIFIILVGFDILRRIKMYNSKLKLAYSYIENISLHWLRNFTILTMLIYASNLCIFLLLNLGFINELGFAYTLTGYLMLFSVFYLSFYGIQQYNVPELNREMLKVNVKSDIIEQNANPKSIENEIIFNEVKSLFVEQQIFTDPELRIGNIAEKLEIPVHKLSLAINAQFEKPFYDFVASYRIELLKQKLVDPNNSHFTIFALATDAGFNSKASLNRIFKGQTGMTPSQYQKSHFAR